MTNAEKAARIRKGLNDLHKISQELANDVEADISLAIGMPPALLDILREDELKKELERYKN